MTTTLTQRQLNRATLARQFLLERSTISPLRLVEQLAGLQAQEPQSWYGGFWSRLENFDPLVVSDLLESRKLVRIALMRSTIHLVTAKDCLNWRPLVQPVIERSTKGSWGKRWAGLDIDEVAAKAKELLHESSEPHTFSQLGKRLQETWPDAAPDALGQIARAYLPLVQVPPRGLWKRSGAAKHQLAEAWLGKPLAKRPSLEQLVMRYLAAFGPASVRDIQAWCGLTRLNEVVDRLGNKLVQFSAEDGRTLYDLPDAPRPDADVVAPVRFLYDYDNLYLSHADRTRVIPVENRQALNGEFLQVMGTVTIDGFLRCTWRIAKASKSLTLIVTPVVELPKASRGDVEAEGARMLAFLDAGAGSDHDIRIER